jgi:hypothetical protein
VVWTDWQDCQALAQVRQSFCTPGTQNAVRPVSLLLWCLGATEHRRTETLRAVETLACTAEVSRQRYRSVWTPWYRGLVVSLAARRCSTAEVFGAPRRYPAMRLEKLPIPDTTVSIYCDTSAGRPRPYMPASLRLQVFQVVHNVSHSGTKINGDS